MRINEKNVFYANRKEIAGISRERKVDMGVATAMWAAEHGVKDPAAQNEWQSMMAYYQQHKTLTMADLLK